MYSVEDVKSIKEIENWFTNIQEKAKKEIAIALVANKVDLPTELIKVDEEEGEMLAKTLGISFYQISSKKYADVVNVIKGLIKELLKNLSTTSQFNNTKVYIIEDTEKMSDTVYNAILKTLEEPSPGIYAILLTNNIDAVKPTIVSRCQKIFVNANKEKETLEENTNIECDEIIENLELNGVESIAKYNKIYTIISDRDKFIKILYAMLKKNKKVLYDIVNEKNDEKNDIIYMKNDINTLSKKILIVDKFISLSANYLNKNLMIDRFIIEMWGNNK